MSLAEDQLKLTAQLAALKNGQDRLALLVARAKERPAFPPGLRTDANLLPGCLAKLWFTAEFRGGKCFFKCDSDSMIVKAISTLLCDLYSCFSPSEILAHNPDFLGPLGITQHLTPNRRNALSRVWEKIKSFAETNATS